MAPALAGSPRVQAHRDYVIKVLLHGLTGPLDGRTYPDLMAPLGSTSSDEWIAGVASYVRSSFGNSAGMVTPADVARVRKETASRKTPWTLPELEATLPRALDAQQWKLTASHGADAAAGAASLRGWSSGAPQAAGMWFTVELPQPALVTELQFDSTIDSGGGAAAGAARRTASARASACHRLSAGLHGAGLRRRQDLGQPVAEGKGEGLRTTITFAPARAKFVRITQTDGTPGAPAWSIRNLRVYEAPSSGRK